LYDPVKYTLSLGGKRIRPFLTLSGCGLCGGEPKEALAAGMAIELLHNFTLLHDDIMDAAETRRGKLSVFKKWDSSTAILSGDAMYAWAFEQLQYYGEKDAYTKEQYAQIMAIFLNSARTVCEGQAYDLEFEKKQEVTLNEYLTMIRGKTAALISGSLQLGGAVAGADVQEMQKLRDIGTQMGTAFQIQDDLLDVVADPSKFGKRRGGDIAEGKKTYLSILALREGNEEQKELLRSVLEGSKTEDSEIEKIIEIYKSLGILKLTREKVEEHYQSANKLIQEFGANQYKDDLVAYLNKLIHREY
jgi:geranylgeranyl diphosphate synthase type II